MTTGLLSNELRKTVENATVTIFTKEHGTGRGFIVPGGLIITAAHCVDFNLEFMPGDDLEMTFEGYDGTRFNAVLEFFEPISDVAVFVAIDEQRSPTKAGEYEQFVHSIKPIAVADLPREANFPICLFSHQHEWITGTSSVFSQTAARTLFAQTNGPIPSGTSGSPILNSRGEAVAVVSVSTSADDDNAADECGSHPVILRCLSRRLAEIAEDC